MEQYEIDHLATVRVAAPESVVLLASDGSFPLAAPGKIALFGAGARRTVKGGTGSGTSTLATSSRSRRGWRTPVSRSPPRRGWTPMTRSPTPTTSPSLRT